MIKLKTKKEFDKFINENNVCCVKFGAEWCGPCKVLESILDELEQSGIDYQIGECDIDDEEIFNIGDSYGIKNIPFICIFKNGELSDISVGVISGEELNNKIKSVTK